jgi:hypothetical protein
MVQRHVKPHHYRHDFATRSNRRATAMFTQRYNVSEFQPPCGIPPSTALITIFEPCLHRPQRLRTRSVCWSETMRSQEIAVHGLLVCMQIVA